MGKKVSDFISDNVKVSWSGTSGSVEGDFKYIKGYDAYSGDEANGNFYPFVLDDSYKGKPITVKRTSAVQRGVSEKTEVDTEWVLRLHEGTGTKYSISSNGTKIADLNFAKAKLATNEEMKIGITKLAESNVPEDKNKEQCTANQKAITVSNVENNYTVSADLNSMQEYVSTDETQSGNHKWFGLIVATGENDIQNVTIGSSKLTEKDVADANSVKAPAGSFILWIKADELKTEPRTLVLKADGKADTTVKITFEDTGVSA